MEKEKIDGMMNAVGALAEMAHVFYAAMVKSGATEDEALYGMQCFIETVWQKGA